MAVSSESGTVVVVSGWVVWIGWPFLAGLVIFMGVRRLRSAWYLPWVLLLELPAVVSRDVSTGNDDIYCLLHEGGCLKTRGGEALEIEPDVLRKPVWVSDFSRFVFAPKNIELVIFPYEIDGSS